MPNKAAHRATEILLIGPSIDPRPHQNLTAVSEQTPLTYDALVGQRCVLVKVAHDLFQFARMVQIADAVHQLHIPVKVAHELFQFVQMVIKILSPTSQHVHAKTTLDGPTNSITFPL